MQYKAIKMACVEVPPANADSEMEEGEIVDELDDLSDISSEEEFLLRQRLQVLENYNNVLERKKAKRTSIADSRDRDRKQDALSLDLSEISVTDLEDGYHHSAKHVRDSRLRPHHKVKRRREIDLNKNRDKARDRRKPHNYKIKKRLQVKVISESSESEDEYKNKRRRLADAVAVTRDKSDTSSLKARLKTMMFGKADDEQAKIEAIDGNDFNLDNDDQKDNSAVIQKDIVTENRTEDPPKICDLIDLSNLSNDDVKIIESNEQTKDEVDSKVTCQIETNVNTEKDSDEDVELLRQHALKTKTTKITTVQTITTVEPEKEPLSEDEDSDTAELRLICLKSALLKKAIEMKQKQKLRKRLSQSTSVQDDFLSEMDIAPNTVSDNNTDIESVDMDIGSDGDDKSKEASNDCHKIVDFGPTNIINNDDTKEKVPNIIKPKEDELDEDEDLLRAKLLTSLSKNLPNLVDPNIIETMQEMQVKTETTTKTVTTKVQVQKDAKTEEKKFIINLGESDSEGEHEATKNLTKMHQKLAEQADFQQKLDLFLKTSRMEVEKKTLPDVVQQPVVPKTPEKFVAKTVKHLPKSEQIEYKNLVKRMAELEKIKQVRQSTVAFFNKANAVKDTLKPRNVSIDTSNVANDLEEQIALSRKKIAEESAKMLKLKEEATKLSQKYKIVATELRNIATAITFNKKEQKSVQNKLSKIRIQHQMLLKSSTSKHSRNLGQKPPVNHFTNKVIANRLQKENNPTKEEYKNPQILKSVKISVVNDLKNDVVSPSLPNSRLSVQIDVSSNKKIVKIPKSPKNQDENSLTKEMEVTNGNTFNTDEDNANHPIVEKGGGTIDKDMSDTIHENKGRKSDVDDYRSPLDAFADATWKEDPNAFLCPFEVGGNCKDPDCKYIHPKIPSEQ